MMKFFMLFIFCSCLFPQNWWLVQREKNNFFWLFCCLELVELKKRIHVAEKLEKNCISLNFAPFPCDVLLSFYLSLSHWGIVYWRDFLKCCSDIVRYFEDYFESRFIFRTKVLKGRVVGAEVGSGGPTKATRCSMW